jgi:Sugar (and other) transporter
MGIYLCPEYITLTPIRPCYPNLTKNRSPRWYMKKHKYMKAYDSLCRLRNSRLQAARDLFYVRHQLLNEEKRLGKDTKYFNRLKSLFTKGRVRRATLAAFVVMIAQQMCGSKPFQPFLSPPARHTQGLGLIFYLVGSQYCGFLFEVGRCAFQG